MHVSLKSKRSLCRVLGRDRCSRKRKGYLMRRILILFSALVLSAQVLATDPKAEVALCRIDCGRLEQLSMADYDDTVFDGPRRDMVNPCYLIRHGSELMLWDTGMSVG